MKKSRGQACFPGAQVDRCDLGAGSGQISSAYSKITVIRDVFSLASDLRGSQLPELVSPAARWIEMICSRVKEPTYHRLSFTLKKKSVSSSM